MFRKSAVVLFFLLAGHLVSLENKTAFGDRVLQFFRAHFGSSYQVVENQVSMMMIRKAFGEFIAKPELIPVLKKMKSAVSASIKLKDDGASGQFIITLVSTFQDRPSAEQFYQLNVNLLKEKDRAFKQGRVKILESEYENLVSFRAEKHQYVKKMVAVQQSRVRVHTLLFLYHNHVFEIVTSRRTLSTAELRYIGNKVISMAGEV